MYISLHKNITITYIAIQEDDEDAQFYMGIYYEHCADKIDINEAVKWYKKDVDKNHIRAMYNLGYNYAKHFDGAKRLETIDILKKASDLGCVDTQLAIAIHYKNGSIIKKDLEEAFKWYKIAAENGDAEGQFSVAVFYEKGVVVEQNMQEAIKWYKKFANNGNPKSQYNLSVIYRYGIGVDVNKREATRLQRQALAQLKYKPSLNLNFILTYDKGERKRYTLAL